MAPAVPPAPPPPQFGLVLPQPAGETSTDDPSPAPKLLPRPQPQPRRLKFCWKLCSVLSSVLSLLALVAVSCLAGALLLHSTPSCPAPQLGEGEGRVVELSAWRNMAGTEVRRFRLTSAAGLEATVISFGATLTR